MAIGRFPLTVPTCSNPGAPASVATAIYGWFATLGLVQTADTGQTAAGSFGTTTTANLVLGYQIWRFNDALQATAPVFFKFEIGSGGSTSAIGFWITIGTGSDGAGNIMGVLLARVQIPSGAGSGTAMMSYFSGDLGRFGLALFAGGQNTSQNFIITLERSKDGNGNDTADGLIFCAAWSSASKYSAYLPFGRAGKAGVGALNMIPQGAVGSLSNGLATTLVAIYPVDVGGPVNPGLGMLGYYYMDLSPLNPTPVPMYGNSHTYLPIGFASPPPVAAWTGSCIAMFYE